MAHPVYEEVIEFIASGATPQQVIDFSPSEAVQKRVRELLIRQSADELSHEDAEELSQFLMLEHVMRLAKARARQKLPR